MRMWWMKCVAQQTEQQWAFLRFHALSNVFHRHDERICYRWTPAFAIWIRIIIRILSVQSLKFSTWFSVPCTHANKDTTDYKLRVLTAQMIWLQVSCECTWQFFVRLLITQNHTSVTHEMMKLQKWFHRARVPWLWKAIRLPSQCVSTTVQKHVHYSWWLFPQEI